MKGEEVMEWKTQRYEGSVGVDGRWVVSRSEAEARAEAAERDRDHWRDVRELGARKIERLEATLAAVRNVVDYPGAKAIEVNRRILAILDREGEPTRIPGEGKPYAMVEPDEAVRYDPDYSAEIQDEYQRLWHREARKLTAVREKLETICNIGETRDVEVAREALAIIHGLSGTVSEIDSRTTRGLRDISRLGGPTESILGGEGEKCPTCGGTDREGGTVATSGPDEFGNYDTDDCPDPWHEAKSTERKPGPLHG